MVYYEPVYSVWLLISLSQRWCQVFLSNHGIFGQRKSFCFKVMVLIIWLHCWYSFEHLCLWSSEKLNLCSSEHLHYCSSGTLQIRTYNHQNKYGICWLCNWYTTMIIWSPQIDHHHCVNFDTYYAMYTDIFILLIAPSLITAHSCDHHHLYNNMCYDLNIYLITAPSWVLCHIPGNSWYHNQTL